MGSVTEMSAKGPWKLTYKHLRSNLWQRAFVKIVNATEYEPKAVRHISQFAKKIKEEDALCTKMVTELAEKYAEKDENGKVKLAQDPEGRGRPGSFTIPEARRAEADEELKKIEDVEFDMDVPKLPYPYLKNVKLSPEEFGAFEDCLFFGEK